MLLVGAGAGSKCFAFIKMGLGWPRLERRRGPAVHNKKTLVSAQNLENKGPEIFLPARSMVLKVVRGKILETLELAWFPAVRGSVLAPRAGGAFGRTQRVSGPGGAFAVRLSKIEDYLADKLCVLMLSEVMDWVQGQSERIAELIPDLGSQRVSAP
jgi:hypothetical protein